MIPPPKPQPEAQGPPRWEQVPPERRLEMIRILSELIYRQLKREAGHEPEQDA